ncbi:DNA adenine methylase, partial [Glaciimonas sp. Cout2]|nr:DNA adenine methylase [Glaciimonas sp. Cout2]
HIELADEVARLHDLGCHVILTNSNHPLVHEQNRKFSVEIIQTRRFISCNGKGRTGEDVIVTIPPKQRFNLRIVPAPLPQ